MRLTKLITTVTILATVSGCSTVVNGFHDDIKVNTKHEDATVIVNGNPVGEGPTEAEIRKGSDSISVVVAKDGCDDGHFVINKQMDGTTLFALIPFPVAIFLIPADMATGAFYKPAIDSIYLNPVCKKD
ncbi:hypothetical protein LA59_17605 [Vibrio harveyi]|uniref:PEGA domain-containing protein n=1 Tax=Vibrio harveyi group TaxID=717610 RepID=UPI0004513EE5|nr:MULTISPECIES: PEGA domain-containing protein [Vibrio harveyi group]ETZ09811.1 hypothetical protein AJ90_14085 [Vibrio parahaemolyticus M0605]AIV07276.1 hypothetical protein LA59_17605 [Vibrio harveyi]ELY2119697.1 PEGA domain-containing protein [Vibrio parahaemolyticus]MBD6963595.1 PEGA domain-containing protein [Vibrio parahaemolyticus]MBM4922444.1 PEGA domain-containing protein [Vibrio parahaemolyticus]